MDLIPMSQYSTSLVRHHEGSLAISRLRKALWNLAQGYPITTPSNGASDASPVQTCTSANFGLKPVLRKVITASNHEAVSPFCTPHGRKDRRLPGAQGFSTI